ncbi:MAG: TolC family protein [Acidobacteria bacterium]|nr:TolC family protein [Acidobacteriota bacterium]
MTPRCDALAMPMIGASIALLVSIAPAAAQPSGSLGFQTTPTQFRALDQPPVWLMGLAARDRPISLREALSLAERQNLEGRRAAARTGIAQQQLRESRFAWIPALAGSVGFGQTTGRVQGSFGDLSDVAFSSVAPFSRVAFGLNPASTWFENAAASHRAVGAEADEQGVRRLVLVRVSELYHALAREQATVIVARDAVQNAQDLGRITDVLLRQGVGRGDDAERARTELASTEQRLIEAERRRQLASIDLAAALDLDPLQTLVPADDLATSVAMMQPEEAPAALVGQALGARPEIIAARQQLEARRRDRSAAVGRVAGPTVEAFYQEGLTGDRVGDLAPLRRSGVAVTWNISASGVQRVHTTAQLIEEASLALAQAEQSVRVDVAGAWTNLQAALARLDRARQARRSADATLRISQVRFRNGTSLALEVLQAQQALESVRLAEVAAFTDVAQAQVRLRAELGPVSPADLSRP